VTVGDKSGGSLTSGVVGFRGGGGYSRCRQARAQWHTRTKQLFFSCAVNTVHVGRSQLQDYM
jgi:hypothetical protein